MSDFADEIDAVVETCNEVLGEEFTYNGIAFNGYLRRLDNVDEEGVEINTRNAETFIEVSTATVPAGVSTGSTLTRTKNSQDYKVNEPLFDDLEGVTEIKVRPI